MTTAPAPTAPATVWPRRRKLILAFVAAVIAINVATALTRAAGDPIGDLPEPLRTTIEQETSCGALARWHQAWIDAFYVELDRPGSDPQRRQMFLARAEAVGQRQEQLGCP